MAVAAAEPIATDEQVAEWPYKFEVIDVRKTFVDETYQRPLTNFVDKIKKGFDPALFNTLILSYREKGRKDQHYATMDGQTRAVAVEELVEEGKLAPALLLVPCLVYYGLSQSDEASLFARLQKERRGIQSFHRFRAALVAKEPEPRAISRIVKACGYEIGVADKDKMISAVAALEQVYRGGSGSGGAGGRKGGDAGAANLERTLLILREAWGERHMPNGAVIRGLGRFLRDNDNVDDDRLARRLATNTPGDLNRRASALREGMGNSGGGADKYMAGAIEAVYRRKIRGDS